MTPTRAWIGPALGIAAMTALFVMGLLNHTPGLMVVAASTAAALVGVGASLHLASRRERTR